MRVFGEERLLTLGVAPIGAEGVAVDELADRQPARSLFGRDGGVVCHRSLIRSTPASGPPSCCIAQTPQWSCRLCSWSAGRRFAVAPVAELLDESRTGWTP